MGAFIRIRSPIYDRRTLFDIGVAGPLAGVVVAVPVLVVGIALSAWTPVTATSLAHQIVLVDGAVYYLGDSLLFDAPPLSHSRARGTLQLHPTAVAGWVGLLVTSFNLLPLAQLDGAHILHAMSARAQRIGAVYVWLALLVLGMLWFGWWIWAGARDRRGAGEARRIRRCSRRSARSTAGGCSSAGSPSRSSCSPSRRCHWPSREDALRLSPITNAGGKVHRERSPPSDAEA